jgi:ribosome-associated toxin RatA of RatAB toxin-antitoxin module
MKKLKVAGRSKNISIEKAWQIVTDIEKYPQRVKYVKKVEIYGIGEGSQWDDITQILWIPIKIRHTVTSAIKNKEYEFSIRLYFGGTMKQKYTLSKENQETIIQGIIIFDLGNKLINNTLGVILKHRLKKMLVSSFQIFGGEAYQISE